MCARKTSRICHITWRHIAGRDPAARETGARVFVLSGPFPMRKDGALPPQDPAAVKER